MSESEPEGDTEVIEMVDVTANNIIGNSTVTVETDLSDLSNTTEVMNSDSSEATASSSSTSSNYKNSDSESESTSKLKFEYEHPLDTLSRLTSQHYYPEIERDILEYCEQHPEIDSESHHQQPHLNHNVEGTHAMADTNTNTDNSQDKSKTAAAATAKKAPVAKANLQQCEEHYNLCLVRKVEKRFNEFRREARNNKRSVEQELIHQGYGRFEDFILSCEFFPMSCNPLALAELGSGVTLYFDFLKFLGFVSMILFLMNLPIMFIVNQGQKGDNDEELSYNLLSWRDPTDQANLEADSVSTWYFSPGNYGEKGLDSSDNWIFPYYFSMFFFLFLAIAIYGVRQSRLEEKCDALSTSPNDYAIMISNLPTDDSDEATEEITIKKWFEQYGCRVCSEQDEKGFMKTLVRCLLRCFGIETENLGLDRSHQKHLRKGDDSQPEVVKVIIAWDIALYNELSIRLKTVAVNYMVKLRSGADPDSNEELQKMKQAFDQINNQLSELKGGKNLKSTGYAIVVFNEMHHHRACLELWEEPFILKLHHFLDEYCGWLGCNTNNGGGGFGKWAVWILGIPMYGKGSSQGERILKIVRAPSPSDINWEDLGRTACERFQKSKIIYLVATIIMIVCFFISFGLQRAAEKADGKNKSEGSSGFNLTTVFLAVIVAAMNGLLLFSASKLAKHEYHNTKTSEESSTMVKMAFFLVINTAFIHFAIDRNTKYWYISSGLVYTMFVLIIMNSIFVPFIQSFDIGFKVRNRIFGGRVDFDNPKISQEKANQYWTPTQLDLPRRYGSSLKIFLVSLVCMPLFPVGLPVGGLGLCIQYWVDKWLFLRRYSRPAWMKTPDSSYAALRVTQLFSVIFCPIFVIYFVGPSCSQATRSYLYGLIFPIMLIGIIFFTIPRSLLRFIIENSPCCECCVQFCAGDKIKDTTSDTKYYDAQLMWGPPQTYHKTHPLYASLPEALNPLNLPKNHYSQIQEVLTKPEDAQRIEQYNLWTLQGIPQSTQVQTVVPVTTAVVHTKNMFNVAATQIIGRNDVIGNNNQVTTTAIGTTTTFNNINQVSQVAQRPTIEVQQVQNINNPIIPVQTQYAYGGYSPLIYSNYRGQTHGGLNPYGTLLVTGTSANYAANVTSAMPQMTQNLNLVGQAVTVPVQQQSQQSSIIIRNSTAQQSSMVNNNQPPQFVQTQQYQQPQMNPLPQSAAQTRQDNSYASNNNTSVDYYQQYQQPQMAQVQQHYIQQPIAVQAAAVQAMPITSQAQFVQPAVSSSYQQPQAYQYGQQQQQQQQYVTVTSQAQFVQPSQQQYQQPQAQVYQVPTVTAQFVQAGATSSTGQCQHQVIGAQGVTLIPRQQSQQSGNGSGRVGRKSSNSILKKKSPRGPNSANTNSYSVGSLRKSNRS